MTKTTRVTATAAAAAGNERTRTVSEQSETMTPQFVLKITLRDGTEHSFEVERMPRNWASWVMRQMPYGTDFRGAQFRRTGGEEPKP